MIRQLSHDDRIAPGDVIERVGETFSAQFVDSEYIGFLVRDVDQDGFNCGARFWRHEADPIVPRDVLDKFGVDPDEKPVISRGDME